MGLHRCGAMQGSIKQGCVSLLAAWQHTARGRHSVHCERCLPSWRRAVTERAVTMRGVRCCKLRATLAQRWLANTLVHVNNRALHTFTMSCQQNAGRTLCTLR